MSENVQSHTAIRVRKRPRPHFKDITGLKFGHLTVIERAGTNICGGATWLCICDCPDANKRVVSGISLRNGNTKSCGCYAKRRISETFRTHGYTGTPIFRCYNAMKARCCNPNTKRFMDYGGRGIKICDRWLKIEAFIEDMAPTWKPGLSLDRKDVNGDYSPENCVWSTKKQQARNKRNSKIVECDGENLTVTDWAERANLPRSTVNNRLKAGWSMAEILNTPSGPTYTRSIKPATPEAPAEFVLVEDRCAPQEMLPYREDMDLLTRLRNHVAMMAPHQRIREQGKLLMEARDEIATLRASIVDNKDKARLDFIQANHSWLTRSKDDAGTDHEWRVSLGMGQNTFDATTARGAIDAAMKGVVIANHDRTNLDQINRP